MASGKALSKRSISVIVAVVLAALAALALTSYVQGAEAKAVAAQQPVDAYVAKAVIPSGTLGSAAISQGLVIKRAIPRAAVAQGAITSLSEIQDKVTTVDILQDEQILAPRFVEPKALRNGLLPIPADRQAMSVQVGIPPGVAGFIQPGDQVSIIAKASGGGAAGPNATAQVQYLLQDIQVLSVTQSTPTADPKQDTKSTQATQQTQSQVLLTLAVTPAEAEKLAFAVLDGQVYFTLVPKDQKPTTTPGRNAGNLFS
jgi:pilus assembly protein CpaB